MCALSVAYTKQFNTVQRAECRSRAVSFIHAYTLFFLCVFLIFMDPDKELLNNPGSGLPKHTPLVGFSTGYFIFDLLVMLFYGPPLLSFIFALHHLVCIFGWTYLFLTRNGIFFPIFQSLCEFSNIFVSLHWFYCKAEGWKNSKAYIVNGVMLWISFVIFRMSMLPCTFYIIYRDFPFDYLLPFNLGFLIFATVVLNVMNLLWFSKISQGLIKYAFGKKKKEH
ncbi:hypothetical protein GEMRC1_002102 [Eukaryota sp. GEM-RC1]